MKKRLIIGSRASKLALIQAQMVADRLKAFVPDIDIKIKQISTTGDRDKETALDKMGTVGVFVKELEKALELHRIDIAVHSLKDMPAKQPEGLFLSAVLEREDPGDVLVSSAGNLDQLPAGARIGTGSLRRQVQLKTARPDLQVMPLRGNIDTRLKKLHDGNYQAIIMAAAALKRLGLEHWITQYLDADVFVPSGCQGIIGTEIRKEDNELDKMLGKINHLPTSHEATAERAFLRVLGAGCHAPVGVKASCLDNQMTIRAMAASLSGDSVVFDSVKGIVTDASKMGTELAESFVVKGAPDFSG